MWATDDTDHAGVCPRCHRGYPIIDRCPSCPVLEMERVRARTSAGRFLERVLEMDADSKRPGFVSYEITEEEAVGLRILDQELAKRTEEMRKDQEEEAAEKRRVWEMQNKNRGRG